MLNIACFRWIPRGKLRIPSQKKIVYGERHINNLYYMCREHINIPFKFNAIVDDIKLNLDSNIIKIPLWDHFAELGGCYTRLFTYSNDIKDIIGDRVLYLDLDILILKNITNIVSKEEEFVYYKRKDNLFNCSMYMMNSGSRSYIWEEFNKDPDLAILNAKEWTKQNNIMKGCSDQAWVNYRLDLDTEQYWNKDDGIYDINLDLKNSNIPANCNILLFPGPRDPSDKQYSKLNEYWK